MTKRNPRAYGDARKVVYALLKTGEWKQDGTDSHSHGILRHTATDKTIAYPLHRSSDRNAVKKLVREAARISGTQAVPIGNRKQSRRRPTGSGFDLDAVRRERRARGRLRGQLQEYRDELAQVNEALTHATERGAPQHPTSNLGHCTFVRGLWASKKRLLAQIQAAEQQLENLVA